VLSARLRNARAEDAAHLSALALLSKAHWGYSAEFMAACAAELTVHEADLARRHYVVVEEGGIRGFYALDPVVDGAAELDALFVHPDSIGRGYGRLLMQDALAAARAAGAARLVIQADPNAHAFYRAAGAVVVGERPSASIAGRMLPLLEIDLG